MEFKRINNIDLLFKKAQNANKAVVVLHGYGASMQDLAPLYEYLDPREQFDWYFLDGNISIDIGYGMTGKAWFHIDMYKLQMAISTGKFAEVFEHKRPDGLNQASELVKNLLENISSQYSEGIVLGGFSQGSMVSLDLSIKYPSLIKKLFLLSSTIFDEQFINEGLKNISDIPVFQSHGQYDPVLPFDMADKLSSMLKENIKDYKFSPFSGGHEIPLTVIKDLTAFINQ